MKLGPGYYDVAKFASGSYILVNNIIIALTYI